MPGVVLPIDGVVALGVGCSGVSAVVTPGAAGVPGFITGPVPERSADPADVTNGWEPGMLLGVGAPVLP